MPETIGVQSVLDNAEFRKGLKEYLDGIAQASSKTALFASKASASFSRLGTSVLSVSRTVGSFAFGALKLAEVGLTALGGVAIKTAIDFESGFAGVAKTTDGLIDPLGNVTQAGLDIQNQFRALSNEIPVSINELLTLGETAGQLGIARDQLTEFTKVVAEMGVTTNLTSDQAATGLAQLTNVMGTVSTYGSSAFNRLASTIVALGNNGASTESQILDFATRMAGAGKIAGVSEADILALSSSLASVGIDAEAGGTAVQKALLKITQSVQTGDKSLATFAATSGMSVDEFKTAWQKDAGSAFAAFVKGLGGQGKDAIKTLQDLGLNDQRMIQAFLSLSNAGSLLTDQMQISNQAFSDQSALQKEAQTRFGTTASQIQLLKNNLADVGLTIGQILLPPFQDLLQNVLKNVVPVIGDFGKALALIVTNSSDASAAIDKLPAPLKIVAEHFKKISDAIGQLLSGDPAGALRSLVPPGVAQPIIDFATTVSNFVTQTLIPFTQTHLPELKGAFAGIGAVLAGAGIAASILGIAGALAALANPITLIIVLAGILGAAWAGDWGGIQEKTKTVVNAVKPILDDLSKTVSKLANAFQVGFGSGDLLGGLTNALYSLGDTSPIFTDIADGINGLVLGLQGASTAGTDLQSSGIANVLNQIGQAVSSVASVIGGFITNQIIPFVSQLVSNAPSALTTLSGAFTSALGTIQPIITAFGNVFNAAFTALQPILASFGSQLQTAFQSAGPLITAFQNLWIQIVPIIQANIQKLIEVFNSLQPVFAAVGLFYRLFVRLHRRHRRRSHRRNRFRHPAPDQHPAQYRNRTDPDLQRSD